MTALIARTFGLVSRGQPGLACDDDGIALGPMPVVEAIRGNTGTRSYRVHPASHVTRSLRLAYGPMARTDLERRLRGLTHVAQLLNDGEEARARIHAVLLAFPEISPDGMAKLVRATELQKYNPDWPDEPRVPAGNPDGGQWTTDGDSSFVETVVSEHELAMSPECMEEWAAARLFCTNLLTAGLLGKRGYLGFGRTYDQCVRGQVSAACGGNPIG